MEFKYDVIVIGAGLSDNNGHEQDCTDELQPCGRWYCKGTDSKRD